MKMKRILSSILATATVASAMLFPTSADIPSVTQEVEALYLTTIPTFDGVLHPEEWGEKSFSVFGSTAAIPGDTAPSECNTFAFYEHDYDIFTKQIISEDEAAKAKITGLTYDVWLRWDTKYFYMAVLVHDPDGYYLPYGREHVWNGDCVQFRVDPMGPNSYLKYKNPEYDYMTEGFDFDLACNIGYRPWAYHSKTCNIGMGIPADRNELQVYDMADQGTGNFERSQKLNDPKKLGPTYVDPETGRTYGNPFGTDVDYASLFGCKITDNGDGTSTNSYEVAVPWAYIDQWGLGQVAVGYAWGMSLAVLNGYDDQDSSTDPFESYLTWGSGICGAQQDDSWLRPTIGGSNAIVLSDKDAISGYRIADIRAYYLGSGEHHAVDGDFELSLDIAYLGVDFVDPEKTYVGVFLGEDYSMAAGWNAYNKEFFIAPHGFDSGINKDIPYAASEEFDWQIGDWHNMTVKVEGEHVTILCDGEVVLEDVDRRYECYTSAGDYSIVTYNIGDFAYDNYKLTTGGEVVCNYTFDSDDAAFNSSDMKLIAIPMDNKIVEGVCKNYDPESLYNCLMHETVNADGESVMKCDFCGNEEALVPAFIYGDVNDDGRITLRDITALMRYIARWDVTINKYAADANCDTKVNLSDVTIIAKYLMRWNVTLGPSW